MNIDLAFHAMNKEDALARLNDGEAPSGAKAFIEAAVAAMGPDGETGIFVRAHGSLCTGKDGDDVSHLHVEVRPRLYSEKVQTPEASAKKAGARK